MKKDTLTAQEAATELGIDLSRVYRLCQAKRLGYSRPMYGGSWVITWAEIETYRRAGPKASGRPPKKPPS